MHLYRFVLGAPLLLSLMLSGGCATLSKQACQEGDWYGIGYEDGTKGYESSRLMEHSKTCLEYGISPNAADYRKGWNSGIALYCTKDRGYQEGSGIDRYRASCPESLEQDFLRGYLLGLEAAESDLHRELSRKSRELTTSALLLSNLKGKEYKKQREEIERLEREMARAENKLDDINRLRREYGLKLK